MQIEITKVLGTEIDHAAKYTSPLLVTCETPNGQTVLQVSKDAYLSLLVMMKHQGLIRDYQLP